MDKRELKVEALKVRKELLFTLLKLNLLPLRAVEHCS